MGIGLSDCLVSDHLIRSDRRTWMYPQRRGRSDQYPNSRVFLGAWTCQSYETSGLDRGEYADWTGSTTFDLYDPAIRPQLGTHFEEGGDPPQRRLMMNNFHYSVTTSQGRDIRAPRNSPNQPGSRWKQRGDITLEVAYGASGIDAASRMRTRRRQRPNRQAAQAIEGKG